MYRRIVSLAIFFACVPLLAQHPNYNEHIKLLYKATVGDFYIPQASLYKETNAAKNENKYSYLWPLCALMQAANEMERLQPGKDYLSPVMKAIDQYYNSNPPLPAYQASVTKERPDTRYYDDNQWIGIAAMDVYHRTKKKDYLKMAQSIYRFMMTGYDSVSGGGIYWREGDKKTKNTCSNGPGILLCLQLYKSTKQQGYLDTALLLYNWVNKYLLSPEGVYYDAIKIPELTVNKATYTYNTGTMLQSNVLLYEILHQEKYLAEAKRIATAAEKHFYVNNKLPGDYWFNAVLLRGFVELYQVEKDKKRLQFFMDDAERVWQQEKDGKNLIGKKVTKRLIDQSAMLEIFGRLQLLEQKTNSSLKK